MRPWKHGLGIQFSQSLNFPEMCNFRCRPHALSSRSLAVHRHEIFQWSVHHKCTASQFFFFCIASRTPSYASVRVPLGKHGHAAYWSSRSLSDYWGDPGSNPSFEKKIHFVLFLWNTSSSQHKLCLKKLCYTLCNIQQRKPAAHLAMH